MPPKYSRVAIRSGSNSPWSHSRLPYPARSDAVGSSESGFNGVSLVAAGAQQKGGGPTVAMGPDTVVLELSDPNVQQALNDAEQQLRAAEADYNSLKARLDA